MRVDVKQEPREQALNTFVLLMSANEYISPNFRSFITYARGHGQHVLSGVSGPQHLSSETN